MTAFFLTHLGRVALVESNLGVKVFHD